MADAAALSSQRNSGRGSRQQRTHTDGESFLATRSGRCLQLWLGLRLQRREGQVVENLHRQALRYAKPPIKAKAMLSTLLVDFPAVFGG
jgi:hypothetical protein